MDMTGGQGSSDALIDAPWGVNPATGRPYTKSPEERAAIGAQLAAGRAAKAAARQAEAAAPPPDPEQAVPIDRSTPDREPGKGRRRRGRRASQPEAKQEAPPAQPYRVGVITRGMNRIYAKIGKILRHINPMVGEAFISVTRKESDDDTTVGEAWEELARVNTVWRARLLKICAGGAAGQLAMAHAPIFLALLMLEPIKKRLPFQRVVTDLLFDEDEPSGAATSAGTGQQGFGPFDDPDLMAMAVQMMGPILAQRAGSNEPRQPEHPGTGTYEQAAA